VALARADVSEELLASIIRGERIIVLVYLPIMMMEVILSSETTVLNKSHVAFLPRRRITS
jgi:hypothetical protein